MPPPTVTNGTSTRGIPAAATIASVHQSDVRSSSVRSPPPPPLPLPPACWTGLRATIVGASSCGRSAEPSVAISPQPCPLSGITVSLLRWLANPPLIHRDTQIVDLGAQYGKAYQARERSRYPVVPGR